jgi:hypothetical protein
MTLDSLMLPVVAIRNSFPARLGRIYQGTIAEASECQDSAKDPLQLVLTCCLVDVVHELGSIISRILPPTPTQRDAQREGTVCRIHGP